MAEFLTTLQTATQIEQIVRGAAQEITLVSPYLQLSRDLGERLLTAEQQGANVRLIYGKGQDIQSETRQRLACLSKLELLYYHDLHAKCYYNEKKLVVTSMNLYQYSARNNREMGVLTMAGERLYRSARKEVEEIAGLADKVFLSGDAAEPKQAVDAQSEDTNGGIESALSALFDGRDKAEKKSKTGKEEVGREDAGSKGFCIRDRESIPYDPERPLCRSCYRKWAEWEDPTYEENYCHRCGRKAAEVRTSGALSMERPECLNCYRERRAEEKQ